MIDLSCYAKTIEGKPVAVFGLGLSGLSCVKALVNVGIHVSAWDDKDKNQQKAKELGAEIIDLTSCDLSEYAALILAPGVPYSFEPHPVVVNAQKYNLEIIGDIELLHRNEIQPKTIGITGTNGKSTTTALMTHVLNQCGIKAVMGGNIGKAVMDLDLNDVDVLVLEISSYQMDLCPTFRPEISILLNITSDHLDRHGSMQSYIDAKASMLDGGGSAIIGVDDDFTQVIFDKTFMEGNRKVFPVSVKSEIVEGFFVSNNVLFENKGGENQKIYSFKENEVETLKGLHNAQNMVCVLAASRSLGIEDQKVFEAFSSYQGLTHRQFLVAKSGQVSYVNDSKATNAEAAAKALSSYDNIYWIVGGRPKQSGLEGLEVFKNKIKKTYVIGEALEEFSAWLLYYGFAHDLCKTLDIAVERAHKDAQEAEEKSTVLLSPACASWDQYKSFEARGDDFVGLVTKALNDKK